MAPGGFGAGLLLGDPGAHYFGGGRIGKGQGTDYAERTGISLAEAERWLQPNLGYEPEEESGE